MDKDLIISHSKDVDGASPVILLKLCKREVEYYLLDNNELEKTLPEILKEKNPFFENIYITDLTLSETFYQWVQKESWQEKLHIFDHHKSHNFACQYPWVTIDQNECATSLFYKYLEEKYIFLKEKNIKEYVEHVKNLDLWLWVEKEDVMAKKLGDLFTILGNEEYIAHFVQKLQSKKTLLSSFEEKILKVENNRIYHYQQKKKEELVIFPYGQYKIGVVFAEQYKSELGMYLQQAYPEIDFVAMINPSGGVSLRTQKEGIDLASLAENFGGGGHPKASGFPVPEEVKQDFIQKLFKK